MCVHMHPMVINTTHMKLTCVILSMLGHAVIGMLLGKLNLEDKMGNPECYRVASLLVRDPGSD